MVETCTQCGGAIGEVGTPYVWKDRVVCAACFSRLRSGRPVSQSPTATAPTTGRGRTTFYAGATGTYIECVVVGCDYRGPSVETRNYSTPLAVLLLLLGIIPGIVYLLLHRGVTIHCPKCGATVVPDRLAEERKPA